MTEIEELRALTPREIEKVFIDTHWNHGLLIHEKSAGALYAGLGEPSEPETGHPIFARLYGEYAATAESRPSASPFASAPSRDRQSDIGSGFSSASTP
jgi:hypothetical protein